MFSIDNLFLLVYLFPGIKNRRGRVFSIAELIANGYASFNNDQATRLRYFDLGRYIQGGNSMSLLRTQIE